MISPEEAKKQKKSFEAWRTRKKLVFVIGFTDNFFRFGLEIGDAYNSEWLKDFYPHPVSFEKYFVADQPAKFLQELQYQYQRKEAKLGSRWYCLDEEDKQNLTRLSIQQVNDSV